MRERKEDIPALVDHFIRRFNVEEGKRGAGVAPRRWPCSQAYDWPGNVRQLENTVFRAIVLCEGDMLEIEDFPQIASLVEGYEVKIPQMPPPAAATAAGRAATRR